MNWDEAMCQLAQGKIMRRKGWLHPLIGLLPVAWAELEKRMPYYPRRAAMLVVETRMDGELIPYHGSQLDRKATDWEAVSTGDMPRYALWALGELK